MAIKLITDTSSDLTQEQAEQLGIKIIPLLVYVDDVEYKDNQGISTQEVIDAMLKDKKVYTGQIPQATLFELFEELSKTKDSYIFLPISSKISGTYATAVSLLNIFKEEHPDFDMTIVDSGCISMGLGLLMMDLAKAVKEGKSKEEIIDFANEKSKKIDHIFTVDKLDWLLKGGRVTKAEAFVGNLLNIKPIIKIEDGGLVPFDKERGNKKKIQKIKNYIKENAANLSDKTVAITHAANMKEAEIIADFLKEDLNVENIIINDLGSVITSHCGPGLIAVFFEKK